MTQQKRGTAALSAVAAAAGATALWQAGTHLAERAQRTNFYDYWRTYYDDRTLARVDELREVHHIRSTGVTLTVDVYAAGVGAPVVVFNHGGGGYAKMFIPLALALHGRGYTVVLPDQKGQGFSEGVRGDVTLAECIQNAIDATHWARERFTGPVFVAGGSLGSAIAYGAAAAGAPVEGVIAHNLYRFDQTGNALDVSYFATLASSDAVKRISAAVLGGLAIPFGWLRVPNRLLSDFRGLFDADDERALRLWLADPVPLSYVSLRYIASLASTPFAVPFEQNRLPVLVINPVNDHMVAAAVTDKNYRRLGGPKRLVEIEYGHWSLKPEFPAVWADHADTWMREQLGEPVTA